MTSIISVTPTAVSTATPLSTTTPPSKSPAVEANTGTPKAEVSYTPAAANFAGNSSGNIANGGFASIQGEWVYYSGNPGAGIYKTQKGELSSGMLINNHFASCINVNGNFVYYINKASNTLYKVKTDGSNPRKLNNDSVGTMHVVGNGYTIYPWTIIKYTD
jgi:hypothetical protein